MQSLHERYGPWALIAGGSEGIGLSFARQLAAAGLNLILLARREAPLESAAGELMAEHGVEVRTYAVDLTAPDFAAQLPDITGSLEIGLLIYNAGAMHGAALYLDEPLAKIQKLIALNCQGPTLLTHHLGEKMRQRQRGGIILLSSLSGLTGGAYIATYAATKAFDIVLAEGLWAELLPHNVHVLGLIAGSTDTPAMAASGINFAQGQAMDSDEVAREGLAQLAHGPIHVAGENNRAGAEILRGDNRRQSVALMSQGAASLYQLPMPELPDK